MIDRREFVIALGATGLLGRLQVAGGRQSLRLGVELALGRGPVHPALAHHPHEIVWACPGFADERQDGERERCQLDP